MFNVKRSLLLALPVVAWVQPYRPMVVVGKSMAPTYASGSVLLTQPIDRPLRRGDVVIVETPDGPIVKRIALLPGDRRIQWNGGEGWFDLAGIAIPGRRSPKHRLRSIPVPVDTVYVLGDNFQVSTDSRAFGPVDLERVTRLVLDQRDPKSNAKGDRVLLDRWITMAQSRKARRV